ncbi:hypothetical protein RT723_09545 [Psychrosphaera aquimarina]|uniref:Glycoside-hydrolase family GH114 TIM-barrel domain-containing protein n=1 Tax=Psychrosphaera aquimarina TaxID=2044854 RepID=A0ABU3R0N5_9GAMM|nr:hypothetical protein [Psychrosphaera aquimarina]MDU0113235.1 hypothetical protein [Psychrosphaera aquimarina]
MKTLALALSTLVLISCGSSSPEEDTESSITTPDNVQQNNEIVYQDVTTPTNKLGAWIFYIDETTLVHNNHQDMANYLASVGIKRVFIKISDINYNWGSNKIAFNEDSVDCGEWQDACEPDNLAHYKQNGIEVWAWTYNDIGLYEDQADMLEAAVRVGYQGYVLDIETEFDGNSTELNNLLVAHSNRLASLTEILPEDFTFAATTWGNPKDHSMDIGLIDDYVDVHMPQTYIEKWGGSYLTDIAAGIRKGDCEYRDLGAEKPIWHIVSHEDKILSGDDLDTFIKYAGPNTSIWRIATSSLMTEIEAVDDATTTFKSQDCTLNNFDL